MAQHALLVGIDCYPGFPPHNQLSSCVGDARLMAEVLQRQFGFREGNINLLCNEKATRQEILAALEGLACWVRSEDIVVFYYSGHGSENRDRAGAATNLWVDEAVPWEQTLVPHDSGRDERLPVRDIRDDEIYEWILKVNRKTENVTVILDSCHAGTAVRSVARIKQVPPILPRDRKADRTRSSGSAPAGPDGESETVDVGASGWRVSRRCTLLAACHHTETAKEYAIPDAGGLKHGAFTWFLVRELRRLAPGSSYRDLMEGVRSGVSSVYPTQTPQVEGARDREVFGGTELRPQPFLPVWDRQGSVVTLAGGAAHGVTVGSEWAVFPPKTRSFEDETDALGRVQVIRVQAIRAETETLSPAGGSISDSSTAPGSDAGSDPGSDPKPGPSSPGKEPDFQIAPGCRASQVVYCRELTLPVRIHSGGCSTLSDDGTPSDDGDRVEPLVTALERRIGESPLLRPALAGEIPGVVVRITPSRTWELRSGDGALLRSPFPLFEPGSVQRVIEIFESRARFLHVEGLEDPDPHGPLRDRAHLTLLRRETEGAWVAAEPSEPVYRAGDKLAFELVHDFDRPLYLYVLDLGLTGGVSLIYPVEGASQAQEPGRRVRFGVRQGDELTVGLPPGYPASEGRERLKLFATTEETDLTWLVQKRYRDAGRRSFLERRLGEALRGGALRESTSAAGIDEGPWTTVTRIFRVRASSAVQEPVSPERCRRTGAGAQRALRTRSEYSARQRS